MGGLPSREASGSIRTLRYGNHEIGLIPLTRQHFNHDNPELCQQFIRVRNDPNVRYCHMRTAGYGMDELPPAGYTQEDLDALVDSVEASLFDTNEDFLNAGAGPVSSFTVAEMHRILQMEGLVDAFDLSLNAQPASTSSAASAPAAGETADTDADADAPPVVAAPDAPRAVDGESDAPAPTTAAAKPPTTRSVESTFRELKAELQRYYKDAEKAEAATLEAMPTSLPDVFQDIVYRRFKRAVRPLTCAVVFIYVNSREEHDCFAFRGHRINVIGCFGLRTYEEESDDTIPTLQIRKGIVKAAGDRTLERVLALAAKQFVDSFTEVVLRELQHRPAVALLKGVGEEARRLLRELPSLPVNSAAVGDGAEAVVKAETLYDPVSVANALFFERMSKYPLLVVGLFNNYPTLKFIYDFSALAISVDEARRGCGEQTRLCTYQRERGVRGLAFLFPGRLLAYTWLWSATQMQPPTVRDGWVQYTLNEYAQSRERRVQQWLETSPTAKTMLGNTATTERFLEHLDNLHSEIVRARTTSPEDQTSWAPAQEYSYDAKLYRIFISPICGPLLTTVKEQRVTEGVKGGGGGGGPARKPPTQPLNPPKPSPSLPVPPSGSDGHDAAASGAPSTARGEKASTKSPASATPRRGVVDEAGKPPPPISIDVAGSPPSTHIITTTTTTAAPAAAAAAAAAAAKTATVPVSAGSAPLYLPPQKPPRGHGGGGGGGGGRDDRGTGGGPPPPSYSATTQAAAAFPMAGVPGYPSQQTLQQLYLQAVGGIAVPTTSSGAPWMVPQFVSPKPPPSPPTTIISPGNSIRHLPPPLPPSIQQQQQQQQRQQAQQQQPSPPAAAPSAAATYILQIAQDGKQTLMPISLGSAAQLSAGGAAAAATTPTTLPSPYQMPGLGGVGMSNPTFLPPGGYGAPQQSLFPLQGTAAAAVGGGGGGGGGVFYAPATSYAPASFITPLRPPPSVYGSAAPMQMPAPVHYPFYSAPVAAPPPPPPPPTVSLGMHTRQAQGPTPPYVAPRAHPHLRFDSTQSLLNRNKIAEQPPPPRAGNGPEETELFANALRLLD